MADQNLPPPSMITMPETKLADLDDIAQGGTLQVSVGDRTLALVRIGDDVYVLDDRCSHADASLAEGDVDPDEGTLECPLHGAAFGLGDGVPRSLPATRPVATYTVTVRDGEVIAEL